VEIDELEGVIETQDLLAFESAADISNFLEDVSDGSP